MKNVVSNVIVFSLIFVVILVAYAKYMKNEPLVKFGPYAILIVLTESMEPTIQKKELILIKEQENYDLYDIVTYLDSYENLITHRIVQMDEIEFIAKGDKNQVVDESMTFKAIQGKVMYHSLFLGILLGDYLKPILIVCLGTWVLCSFRKIRGKKEINEEQK